MYVTCYVTFINYYWCVTTNFVFSMWQSCIRYGELPKLCQDFFSVHQEIFERVSKPLVHNSKFSDQVEMSAILIHHWFYKLFNQPVIDKSINLSCCSFRSTIRYLRRHGHIPFICAIIGACWRISTEVETALMLPHQIIYPISTSVNVQSPMYSFSWRLINAITRRV